MAVVASKVVGISDVRRDATELIEHAKKAHEPVLVCVRSRPAVYIVDDADYERMQDQLRRLRHAAFWQGVEEAEREYFAGQARSYEDVDSLIGDLGLGSVD